MPALFPAFLLNIFFDLDCSEPSEASEISEDSEDSDGSEISEISEDSEDSDDPAASEVLDLLPEGEQGGIACALPSDSEPF